MSVASTPKVHGRSRLASGPVVAVSKDDGVRGLVTGDDLKAPFGEFDYHFENPVDKSNVQVCRRSNAQYAERRWVE
jgi:hypothetical protein